MSAEQDPNLQPSATEAITTELQVENSSDQKTDQAAPHMPSGKGNSTTSSGAATAVVRAPESAESLPLSNVLPEELSIPQQDGSEPAAASSEESTPASEHSETT